jgi:membrane fusion protein, copper/silver efflux system
MKKLKKIGFLVVVFTLFVSCNSKNKEAHEMHDAQESVYYTCSMHPQIKEDKPGKCPICHMDLIPVKKEKEIPNEISLNEQQIKLGNITTGLVGEAQNSIAENYTGVLAINQENLKSISSRAMGRIEKLYFKTEGDYIQKNQAVYQLYSEPVAIAKKDYLTAYKQLGMPGDFGKNAQKLLDAAKQKLVFFGLSNAQITAISKNNDISPYTTFYSTYSGTVSELNISEGAYVMEGTAILKVAYLNSLWLETQVNVNYSNQLHLGQTATIAFADFPNLNMNATIAFINPEINPDTRLLLVRMEVANPKLLLKPGMQAMVQLTQTKQKGIFIPVDAVIRDEKATFIWIEKRPGVFENKMVETGLETDGMIEIKTPLDTTKRVVMTGAYAINSEYIFRTGKDPMAGMEM